MAKLKNIISTFIVSTMYKKIISSSRTATVKIAAIAMIITSCVASTYAQDTEQTIPTRAQVAPVYSKTTNANCFLVGNTNTQYDLEEGKFINENDEKYGQLKHIVNKPGGDYIYYDGINGTTGNTFSVTNVNYADFCIEIFDECGTIKIEDARLNWGGRIAADDIASMPQNVYIKITDQDGQSLTTGNAALNNYIRVNSNPIFKESSQSSFHKGFYICHKEIKDIIQALIDESNLSAGAHSFRMYVANIPVKLKADNNDDKAGYYSGWSFSLVYQHPLLSKRSIMVYQSDLFGEANEVGQTAEPIYADLLFGNSNQYSISDTITFAMSVFGGMANQADEYIVVNRDTNIVSKIGYEDRDHKFYGNSPLRIPFFSENPSQKNAATINSGILRGMINYQYKTQGCDVTQFLKSVRGYDLQKTTLDPGNFKYIKQNGKSFNLCITPSQEMHFFTNALLYIGVPDAPEAALPMEVDKTDIQPDEDFKVTLYVKTGDNKNGLTNINVRVPISEYVDSIVNCNISFHKDVQSTSNGTHSNNCNPSISTITDITKSTKGSNTSVSSWNDNNNDKFMKEAIPFMNSYLEKIDKINDNYATTKPSVVKTREIVFEFDKLVIPSQLKDANAITITLTLHSKKEDDPVYNKKTYLGERPQVIPQAELDLTDNVTKDTSVFESSYDPNIDWREYRCELNGSGDGDGGGGGGGGGGNCAGLNGDKATGSGIYKKNKTKMVEININAEGDCRETPDTIKIHFCDEVTITPQAIKVQLAKLEFDLDSIIKVDSCIWERAKRDMLVDFSSKHGVNRALLEQLLSNYDNPIQLIDTTQAWQQFFNCQTPLDAEDVDSIVNMKKDFSDIYVLFKGNQKDDTLSSNVYEKSEFISLRDESKLEETFTISDDDTLYVYYKSPWKGNGNSCSEFMPICFIKDRLGDPIFVYDNDTIAKNDTIYSCLGNELSHLKITKYFEDYNLYATIIDTIGDPENVVFNDLIDKTYSKVVDWNIQKTGKINTNIPGTRTLIFKQKDLANSCLDDGDTLFIKVLDLKIDETPDLSENTELSFCRSTKVEDSIPLKVTKDAAHQDYQVFWYEVTKTEDEVVRTKIGEGDEIKIGRDSIFSSPSITIRYEATYFKDHCESNPSPIDITLYKSADSILTDTMVICQYYKLKEDEVLGQLKDWNPGRKYTTDSLVFYPYYDIIAGDIQKNMEEAIKGDSVLLARLLKGMDTESGCATNGFRFVQFVVRGITDKGCFGEPSLVTVKINCHDKTTPKFKGDEHFIRYCTGDTPKQNFNDFLAEPAEYESGYKWVWLPITDSLNLPQNKYKSTAYESAISGGNPATNTIIANTNQYIVVRIDSNSCVSQKDSFKIIVADAITSYAMIGDTTTVINTNEPDFALNYCKGDNPYSSKQLPAVGYPSRDYIMEWYNKDFQTDDCDTLSKYKKNRLAHTIDIDFNQVDTIYYCMRQSTNMGCKGPWLNVTIIVHDNVKERPDIDTVKMCEGDFAQKFKIHPSSDPNLMLYLYGEDKTTEVLESEMVVDTIPGKYLFSENKSLYYAQYKNKVTQCYGEMIGTNAIINPKPHLPQMNEDTTVYLCANGDTVNLGKRVEAAIDPSDYDTRIVWTPNDTVITNGDISSLYKFYQQDSVTLCAGDPIEITVKVSNTIKYTPFGTKRFCYGESISIRDTVNRLLRHNDNVIAKSGLKYNVYLLNGDSRGIEITQNVKSSKSRHESDTTRYLINIYDEVSGCEKRDTATIIFHALPDAKVVEKIEACQDVAITLPTPTNQDFNYIWKRSAGDKIEGVPTLLALSADETITLTEENKLTGCQDTFEVKVTVFPTPANALVRDTVFCQSTSSKEVKAEIRTSDDAYNKETSNFSLLWFNSAMESVENPLDMDTITMNELSQALNYTVRQRNNITQCFRDTTITVTLKKSPVLAMPDLKAVCEPDTISFVQQVNKYLSENIASTNLANLTGVQFKYGKIINGSLSALTKEQAEEITYTSDIDSVLYTYTLTDVDNVCSASDSVFITINKKPLVPVIESGLDTIYFCQDDAPIRIGAEDKNEEKYPTAIYWGDYKSTNKSDSLTITARAGNYTAFTKNEKTGCVSDLDTIHAVISYPIDFIKIAPQHLCFRDSLDLYGMVEKQVAQNKKNSKSDLRFNIYRMSGNVSLPTPIVKKVGSNKAINENDTTRYAIEIKDYVSGCEFHDTATVIFHGLPVIDKIQDIVVCQYQDTALPTPDKGYMYEWFRASNNMLINDPSHFNTDIKEYLYLKATEQFEEHQLSCYDSLNVYMDVQTIPTSAIVASDTFCQFSGEQLIKAEIKESQDNPRNDLSIQWIDEEGNTVPNPINTDEVEVNGKSRALKYTIRQYNKITGCYKDTIVPFVVNKGLDLQMEDLKAVCQPEVIDFRGKVLDYLTTANTNISNVGNCDITFGKIVNLSESALTDEEASNIAYTEGIDSMLYVYHVKDNVCESADSVYVTINRKPATPVIEEGIDTIYFCASNQEMRLVAKQENDKRNTKIFWGDYNSTTYGDTLAISGHTPVAKYTAFSKNILSRCTSGFDTIIAVVKETIKVEPIGEEGTIVKCEGEVIDLYELAYNSFKFNKAPNSSIKFSATENGYPISEDELRNISRTSQDTSHYLFTVEDDVTGCDATNRLTLIYHKNPTFAIEGTTILCEGENIELKATGEQRPVSFAWMFEESPTVVNTTDAFLYRNITHDTTVVLIEKLSGTLCADTVSQFIKVNVAPTQLADTAIAMCQDTAAKKNELINMNRSNDEIQGYLIKWYDDNDTPLSETESIEVDKRNAATFKYQVETINKNTGCVSQRSNVVVTINPQITIGLDQPDTICQPFTYDLAGNLAATISGGTRPTYVNTTLNGTEITNDDAIAESGLYTVHYTDDNQCDAAKTISIQFFEQPGTPQLIGDTIVCQGSPTVKLTAKRVGANSVNQTFEWRSAAETTVSDTLYLNTKDYGKTPYTLRAVDKKSQCFSEPIKFNFDIRESIGFSPIGLLEGCYGTTIDLAEKLKGAHSGSDEEKTLSYFFLTEANSLNAIDTPESIAQSGRYVVKASETESGCARQDTVEVLFHDSLAITTEGTTVICQGEEINDLKALNADDYLWIRANGTHSNGAQFPFATSVQQSERFQIIGEKKVGSLFCKDSIYLDITVNSIPAILPDTNIFLCQDTAGTPQSIARNVVAQENEKLMLIWKDAAGDTLFNGTDKATSPVTEEGTTHYFVSQVNKETQCTNKAAEVVVNVLPQINIHFEDTTTCVPNSISLSNIASTAATAGKYTDDITVIAYELMNNGNATDVSDQADALTQEGTYRVRYQYESNGVTCQSENAIQLHFNKQPIRPAIADQNFCQKSGDHELVGKVNSTHVRLLWEDLSVYPAKVDTNTATVSTDIATQKMFLIRQIQDLSGCVSEADTAMITIYPAIESIDKDTAICFGEAVDLNQFAKGSYLGGTPKYSVSFKNADGQNFTADHVTKSNTYFAFYADSANVCRDTATFKIEVDQPIELSIEGTGFACTDQTVTLSVSGAEQYEWSNGEKGDQISVTSEESAIKQYTVEGRRLFHDIYCAADTTVSIEFRNAVTPRVLTFDTCAGNPVTIQDVILKNQVAETVDTIWNRTDDIRYSNLQQNLGKTGSYEIAVHNDEGCHAHHTLAVKMHQVDNLKVDRQASTYCYGSLANFSVSGENARSFEWNNLNDGTIKEGARYDEPITGNTDFMLIATEKELGCQDTVRFSVEAYPKKNIIITGNPNSCRDSIITLSVESALTDIQWNFGDSIVKERTIHFVAEESKKLLVSGIDENGCPTEESILTDVVYLDDPTILFDLIEDSEYALSDDVNEIELRESNIQSGSEKITYTWNFGDGRSWKEVGSNYVTHSYNDTIIRSRRDIPVNLVVEHEYGCKKSANTILKIDPFIFVPNTMIADGEYVFMENYDLQIFDRVGTLIYQGRGWDGTYKGMPASEDTYFYALTYYEKGEKIIKTGFITLVRP